MRIATRLFALSIVTAAASAGVMPQGHPHFNDGGTLTWFESLAEAKAAAKTADKLIFLEYGRKA